jgi:hypothetical protein
MQGRFRPQCEKALEGKYLPHRILYRKAKAVSITGRVATAQNSTRFCEAICNVAFRMRSASSARAAIGQNAAALSATGEPLAKLHSDCKKRQGKTLQAAEKLEVWGEIGV